MHLIQVYGCCVQDQGGGDFTSYKIHVFIKYYMDAAYKNKGL